MIKKELQSLAGSFDYLAKTNRREILTGISLVETVINGAAWCRTGAKASEVIRRKNKELKKCKDDETRKAIILEGLGEIAPSAIVSTGTTVLTCVTIVKNHNANTKQIAALTTAYAASESILHATEAKMEEIFGKKKAAEVKNKVAQDDVKKSFDGTKVVFTGDGDIWCMDSFTKRCWRTTTEEVRQAIDKLNLDIARYNLDFVSLNDFYITLGIETIPNGEELGFDFSDSYNSSHNEMPIVREAVLNNKGEPVLYLAYEIQVNRDHRTYH